MTEWANVNESIPFGPEHPDHYESRCRRYLDVRGWSRTEDGKLQHVRYKRTLTLDVAVQEQIKEDIRQMQSLEGFAFFMEGARLP